MDNNSFPLQLNGSAASFHGCEIAQAGLRISDTIEPHLSGRENSLALSLQVNSVKFRAAERSRSYIFNQDDCPGQVNTVPALQLNKEERLHASGDANKHSASSAEASEIKCRTSNGPRVEPSNTSIQERIGGSTGEAADSNSTLMDHCKNSESGNANELVDFQSSPNQGSEMNINSLRLCKPNESCKETTSSKEPLISLLQEKEELLKLLRNQNGSSSFENKNHISSSQCKILTKYVFINKPTHRKAKKKKFGLPCRKVFRHIYKSKLKTRKKKSELSTPQGPSAPVSTTRSSLKAHNRLSSRKSYLHHELEKDLRRGGSADDHGNSNLIEARSANKRKVLSLDQKVEIIRAMDKPHSSLVSVSEQYKISRSVLWRILKKKANILARHESGETMARKRRKYSSDEEAKPNSEGAVGISNEDDDWLNSDCPGMKRKFKLRNRKDLTLEEKVSVIQALETPGTKINAMAKKFGVSVSSISRINKNKDFIMLRSSSGDLSSKSKRSRECKDPELDRVLLKWYRAMEKLQPGKKISISNVLLKEKAHDLAVTMGKNYFPSDNWIIRWKHRHNLVSKVNMIQDRIELQKQDTVSITDILDEAGKHQGVFEQVRRESEPCHAQKAEQFIICECCGVLTNNKKKKENQHLQGCPASAVRKDLTLEEKVQVVRALEEPGVKMIHLAKRYGVSASAISRIAKNRVDILARKASGLSNSQRKRDRGSKEPEVEKALCEWFKVQHEMGVHISGSMIREKARDIAHVMGKSFWPTESWVFRWRQRNNVSDMNAVLYADSEEDENNGERPLKSGILKAEEGHNTDDGISDIKVSFGEETRHEGMNAQNGSQSKKNKKKDGEQCVKKIRLPRSVMCEKCGFVSSRVNNSRVKTLRHAKGCPDMKPRHELTYETRAKMLKALEESGATLSSVARQFGVSVSSMSRINANKERILNHCLDHSDQKRIRFCKEPEVAQSLYQWYMERNAEGVHVTGPKLKETARKMAAELGRDFKASSGWLGRWRQRYNIPSSIKSCDKVNMGSPKKKKNKKIQQTSECIDHMVHFQPMISDMHQDSLGSSASLILNQNEVQQTGQQNQQPPVFLHQRFSTPWEMTQQQAGSCVWTKDFLSPSMGVGQEDGGIPVTFAYNDGIPKPLFHNMFESFPSVSYQVAMPIDSAMMARDFLKSDNNEDKVSHGPSLIPQAGHAVAQHGHQLPANLPAHLSLQHHMASGQVHSQQPPPPHRQQHLDLSAHNPPLPPSPALMDDDPEQQRQVMEAFKIMNSFAQKKSLGDHVQAALRTIEMTMKSQSRKPQQPSSRNTYTSI